MSDLDFDDIFKEEESFNSFKDNSSVLAEIFVNEFEKFDVVKKEQIFDHEPVNIIRFIEGREYLDLGSATKIWVMESLEEMFQGWDKFEPVYREAVISSAIGVGKSYLAGISTAYISYLLLCLHNPQKYFGMAKGTKYSIINNSVNAKQAKKGVFGETYSKIVLSKWFRLNAPWNEEVASELQFDIYPTKISEIDPSKVYKNLYIIPGNSNPDFSVGYNLFMGIIDEASKYGENTDGEDIARVIYETMRRRITSRFPDHGFMLVLGSPEYIEDFLETRYQESLNESHVFSKRITAWDARFPNYRGKVFHFDIRELEIVEKEEADTIEIPVIYEEDFKNNPEKSIRELGAMPTNSVTPFFTNFKMVEQCYLKEGLDHKFDPLPLHSQGVHTPDDIDLNILKPYDCYYNVIHIDLGWLFDAGAMCMCSLVDMNDDGSPVINMDLAIRLQGTKDTPVQFMDVRKWIYALREMGFRIDMISLDGAQSVDTLQILEAKGYESRRISVDINVKPYTDLKETINAGRLTCYRNTKIKDTASNIMFEELKRLEDIKGKKVDHPRNFSKDGADALCGAVHSILLGCVENRISAEKCGFEGQEFIFSESMII